MKTATHIELVGEYGQLVKSLSGRNNYECHLDSYALCTYHHGEKHEGYMVT